MSRRFSVSCMHDGRVERYDDLLGRVLREQSLNHLTVLSGVSPVVLNGKG